MAQKPKVTTGARPLSEVGEHEELVRNDRVRQRVQVEPAQLGRLVLLDQPRLAAPALDLEEEVDPLVDRVVVARRAVHAAQRHEVVRVHRDVQLLGGLPARGLEHRLVGLDVAGGRGGPEAVHVARAAAQLEQHLRAAVVLPPEDHVGRRHHLEAVGHVAPR